MNDRLKHINEVVVAYTGNIYSIGSAYHDDKAYQNLEMLMGLIDAQMFWIFDEYNSTKKAFEGSRIASNELCYQWLKELNERISEVISEDE